MFYHENKDKVTELTKQISGGAPGSQAFLGALQDATSRLWKKLSSEEQGRYRELAKEWSDERTPKHIQDRYGYTQTTVIQCKTNLYSQISKRIIQESDSSGLSDPAI